MSWEQRAANASAIIKSYGAAATLTRVEESAYDANTGELLVTTTTTQSIYAVVFDYDAKYIDGTHVLRGDKQAYIGGAGVTAPRAGDVLTWGEVDYAVIACKPLQPALVAVLYELQVRG